VVRRRLAAGDIVEAPEGGCTFPTSGSAPANIGDWIVRSEGEIFGVTPDAFAALYEHVTEPADAA
jgi:hypothetical protein